MVGEGRGAGPGLSPFTGISEHVLCSVDVYNHCLSHKCNKTFWKWKWKGTKENKKYCVL